MTLKMHKSWKSRRYLMFFSKIMVHHGVVNNSPNFEFYCISLKSSLKKNCIRECLTYFLFLFLLFRIFSLFFFCFFCVFSFLSFSFSFRRSLLSALRHVEVDVDGLTILSALFCSLRLFCWNFWKKISFIRLWRKRLV